MNVNCYFCGDTGLLSSDEACNCLTNTCKCHNCLSRRDEEQELKQRQKMYASNHHQWEQPELPFNKHKKVPTGYEPEYNQNKTIKKKITKPDPATVEAELQLEEQLWQS
jgi:hypothetical protein